MTIFLSSLILFLSTNIDDVLLLTMWFSTRKRKSERKNVFIGQFLGFSTIIVLSLIGSYTTKFFLQPLIGLLGFIPIVIGIKELINIKNNSKKDESSIKESASNTLSSWSDILNISILTFANGGDNIGIYIPSFTILTSHELILLILIFYVMLFFLCFLTLSMVKVSKLSWFIEKYIVKIIPYILILIGLLVLYENQTINLLFHF